MNVRFDYYNSQKKLNSNLISALICECEASIGIPNTCAVYFIHKI